MAERPCKRANNNGGDDAELIDAASESTKDELGEHAGIMESFKTEILGKMDAANNTMRQTILESVYECVNKIDATNQRRFSRQDAKLLDLEERLERLEGKGKQTETQLGALETGLAAANVAVPDPPRLDFDDFDRNVDHTVLKIRAVDPVSADAASAALSPVFEEMGLTDNDVELEGPQPGRAFTLRFKGAAGLAANRATKFLGLQKVNGRWRDFMAKTPGGGGESKLYVDRDKNKRTTRAELIGRKLLSTLREKHPGVNLFFKRSTLSISAGWSPLAKIIVESPSEFSLRWNIPKAEELAVAKDEVLQKVKGLVAEPEDRVQWG